MKMELHSKLISLGLLVFLALELVTAQDGQCRRANEEWSYPFNGCNTCVPIPCQVRQEYGCNCKAGYTRSVVLGTCISRRWCPLSPPPLTTTTEPPTTTFEPTTTTTMEPTTTTMG